MPGARAHAAVPEAAGCWLLAVDCWLLLAAGCWLLAVGCWLLGVAQVRLLVVVVLLLFTFTSPHSPSSPLWLCACGGGGCCSTKI